MVRVEIAVFWELSQGNNHENGSGEQGQQARHHASGAVTGCGRLLAGAEKGRDA